MIDLVYSAATIGFFAIMIAYVRGCAALGREGPSEDGRR